MKKGSGRTGGKIAKLHHGELGPCDKDNDSTNWDGRELTGTEMTSLHL